MTFKQKKIIMNIAMALILVGFTFISLYTLSSCFRYFWETSEMCKF